MTLTSGQLLNNRYRIVSLLGQGGFGAVYRAWDVNLDEPIALKESFETNPVAQKQFQLEAKLLFKLRHENLPRVHDYFVIPGQGMYLVMDFIEGEDLASMLERNHGPLPTEKALDWASQVCDALAYLHSQNPPIIHRDIKPANIRITPEGRAMLVDFGIAKVYDPQIKTTIGARAITPGFSPNEQYLSSGRTDARTDLYALGATLYMLLTGQAPPEALERSLGAPVMPVQTVNPAVSEPVASAITRAMEPMPDARFASAMDFKTALHAPAWVQVEKQPQSAPRQAASLAPTPQTIATTPPPATQIVPQNAQQQAAVSKVSAGLALFSLAACSLGLFFLFQVPPESMISQYCNGMSLTYGLPPWLPGLLLGLAGAGQIAWLLSGAKATPLAAGVGALTLLASAASLFILYRAPTTSLVETYCPQLKLTYAILPGLTGIMLGLTAILWVAWLAWFGVRYSQKQ